MTTQRIYRIAASSLVIIPLLLTALVLYRPNPQQQVQEENRPAARQNNEKQVQPSVTEANQDIMSIPFSITFSSLLNRQPE